MSAKKTFAGFGFGPIQSGLFLYEAHASENFSRYVVAEVDAELVAAVRDNGGAYWVNIARRDRIDQVKVEGVELCNPRAARDRQTLLAAISQADEVATCLPSVAFFDTGNETSVARMLSAGLSARKKPLPTIVYTAENHNHAAEILLEHLQKHCSPQALDGVQALNTVIGKMSGVITDEASIKHFGLKTITPKTPRAILVEEFNRILISRVTLPKFRRGIGVFIEKDDLLPFEEAKLYGHNAIHALIGYLAELKGCQCMAEAGRDERTMQIARRAFLEESGGALIKRHAKLGDALFTPDGYRAYAEDLLDRMIRPNLNDLISRVCRDAVRKLGYEDRLFGTMRLALEYGLQPKNLALGAAAGVLSLIKHQSELKTPLAGLPKSADALDRESLAATLKAIWGDKADSHAQTLIELTWNALGSDFLKSR